MGWEALNLTHILLSILAFFLVDLVRQLKALRETVSELCKALAVETALRGEMRSDIDGAHEAIRLLTKRVVKLEITTGACKIAKVDERGEDD